MPEVMGTFLKCVSLTPTLPLGRKKELRKLRREIPATFDAIYVYVNGAGDISEIYDKCYLINSLRREYAKLRFACAITHLCSSSLETGFYRPQILHILCLESCTL